ncbi:MAG: HAD family hydrolase [Patescibacteria group bacterium]
MKNKKIIIFDFDGVIIDSCEHAYHGNLRSWPDLKLEEHKNLFSGNIFEELEKLPPAKHSEEERSRWWKEEHNPKKKHLPVFDGIQDVIKQLAKDYTLVINTSADSKSTNEYLKDGNINLFDAIYGNEISKSKIEKFNRILADYKIDPKDCIFITDTVGDVLDANALSIPTLVVTYGYQEMGYFSSLHDKVIGFADKPSDILNFLTDLK